MTVVFVFFAHILGMPSDISKFLPYVVYMRENIYLYHSYNICALECARILLRKVCKWNIAGGMVVNTSSSSSCVYSIIPSLYNTNASVLYACLYTHHIYIYTHAVG